MAKRPADEVEVEAPADEQAEESGIGLEAALIFATSIALLLAIVVGLLELKHHYGAGMLS